MNTFPHEAQQGDHPHTQPPHDAAGHHGAHHGPNAGNSHVDPPASDSSGAGSDRSPGSEPQGAETAEPPASTD